MIRLRVNSPSDTVELGSTPAPYFKLEGPLLCQGPKNQMIGCFCDPSWEVLGATVECIECVDRVIVRFLDWQDDASAECGPFDRLRFSSDACFAGTLPVARFIDESNCWRRDSDGSCWPRMLLLPQDFANES